MLINLNSYLQEASGLPFRSAGQLPLGGILIYLAILTPLLTKFLRAFI